MYPYQKPQLELLLDLIKEANPGIQFPFNPSTMKVSTPVTQAVPADGIADTNIVISPKSNDYWFGSVKVQYRRLSMDAIFKNMTPVPVEFYSATPTTTTGRFVEVLNKSFGTSFLPNDFNWPPNTDLAQNQNFSLIPVAGNLCYSPTGGALFIWRNVKPTFNEVSAVSALAARSFPGGNDFTTPGRKPQGEYLAYSFDFTDPALYGTGSGTIINNAGWIKIFSKITALDPRFDVTKAFDQNGGVQGLTYMLYTLPNALVPEANSAKFKYVMTLSTAQSTWFQGRILMHYN